MVKANGYGLGAVAGGAGARAARSVGLRRRDGRGRRGAPGRRNRPAAPASPARSSRADRRPTSSTISGPRSATPRRSGLAARAATGRSTSRSTRGWRAPASAGTTTRRSAAARGTLERAAGWEGVFTHFHSRGHRSARPRPSSGDRFQAVLGRLPRRPALVHAANSAAALQGRPLRRRPDPAGHLPVRRGAGGAARPQPVAALRARVWRFAASRPGDSVSYGATWRAAPATTVATLAIGYADGFSARPREPARPPEPRLVELGRGAGAAGGARDHGHDAWSPWTTFRSRSGMWRRSIGGRVSLDAAGGGGRHHLLRAVDGARPPGAPALQGAA